MTSMVDMQKGVHHFSWSCGLSFKCRELLADHGDQSQQGELKQIFHNGLIRQSRDHTSIVGFFRTDVRDNAEELVAFKEVLKQHTHEEHFSVEQHPILMAFFKRIQFVFKRKQGILRPVASAFRLRI